MPFNHNRSELVVVHTYIQQQWQQQKHIWLQSSAAYMEADTSLVVVCTYSNDRNRTYVSQSYIISMQNR